MKLWDLCLIFFSIVVGTIAEHLDADGKPTQIELAPPPPHCPPSTLCGWENPDPDFPGVPICCLGKMRCANFETHLCCPVGQVGTSDGTICCPNELYKNCGGKCCASNCSNGVCCPSGHFGVNGICCPSPTDNNCGGKCCSGSCFSGTCCLPSQYLSNGVCCNATEICCPAGLVLMQGRCCEPDSVLCAGNCCKGICYVQFGPVFPPGRLPQILCLPIFRNLTESSSSHGD